MAKWQRNGPFRGPAVADVEANFVQRWNGATKPNGTPTLTAKPPSPASDAGLPIQIVRTIAPKTYPDMPEGETSIRSAMLAMIDGAQSNIYFENQYFYDEAITAAIHSATERGVRVVGLLCREPDKGEAVGTLEKLMDAVSEVCLERPSLNPSRTPMVQMYAPITNTSPSEDIYVHCKTMIADDRYLLTGSANIAFPSLEFHSEMCVLIDEVTTATSLRRKLWCEHLSLTDQRQLPGSFNDGADMWESEAKNNVYLKSVGKAPNSRILKINGI